MLLRGGQRTSTPILDRVPFFDERSRGYPVIEPRTVLSPRSYTWALNQTVLDQGQEGACVGFAVTHELASRPVEVKALDAKFAREKIYWEAQKIDPWAGGAYPGATPFYEGTAVLAGIKAAQKLGHYSSYRWAFGLDDLILAVGYRGPAVLGLNWYEGMFEPDAGGIIRPTGSLVGGHAIIAVGVSLSRRAFLLANSWGPDWSTIPWGTKTYRGYCRVTFADMDRLLKENGEACIPTRVTLS
jgi:hypothetical protein